MDFSLVDVYDFVEAISNFFGVDCTLKTTLGEVVQDKDDFFEFLSQKYEASSSDIDEIEYNINLDKQLVEVYEIIA